LSLGILSLYLGLVALGQWQADEYDYFARLKTAVWPAFIQRLQWSPRPVGETLYLGYGLLANALRLPLSGWFLGALWAGFLLCTFATGLTIDKRDRRLPALMIGVAVAAACLTSGPVFQVFYWPAGAVAYLTTLSATLLVFLQVVDDRLASSRGRTLCCVALLAAALSSEMGALLAVCFAILQVLITMRGWTGAKRDHQETIWWLFPGVASLAVLLWVALHRLPVNEDAFTVQSGSLHHPLQSVISAVMRLALEVSGWSSGMKRPTSALINVIARLALGVGVAILYWSSHRESQDEKTLSRRYLLVLATTLVAACFLSLFASYLHFGYSGGERYETLRRCWLLMAYIAVIIWLRVGSARAWRANVKLASSLLMLGLVLPWHISPLMRQYAEYRPMRNAVEQTFQSGYAPGEQMTYVAPPTDGLITPATLAPGTYTRKAEAQGSAFADYILTYFGKRALVVTPVQ
jgi:hypothetical protein